MILCPHVQASRTAMFSPRTAIVLAFLLLLSQGKLLAQPAPPYGQAFPHTGSYGYQTDSYGYGMGAGYGPQPYQQPYSSFDQGSPYQADVQPLGPQQLEQLVAPIALYPDALLAQVLAASTYPDQVSYVNQWRQSQGNAPPEDIAAAADQQNWDPSLKALTAFPQVLAQMAANPQWTSDLGNAYYNQPQDVLGAVQALRQRAQAAGNLQSTPQQAVRYYDGNIQLAPQNPNVVYVPSYNPWNVYGQSMSPYPGFSLLGTLGQIGQFIGSSVIGASGSSPVSFGLGILMSAFNQTPWGWLSWGLNWLVQSVLFQHNDYYSHSATVADWGFPYGGPRAFRAYAQRRYGHSGGYNSFGHGYQTIGYRQRSWVAHNNFAPRASRPGWYGQTRNSYRPGWYRQNPEVNRIRAGSVYGRPGLLYRPPPAAYSRSVTTQPIYRRSSQNDRWPGPRTSFAGGYPGKTNRSGFHLFGGGHSMKGFSGSSHKPHFGGGHSLFGGHSSGHFGGHGGGHGGGHFHGHHR